MTNRLQVHDAITNQNNYYPGTRYPAAYSNQSGPSASSPMGVSFGYQTITISPSNASPTASPETSEAAETPSSAPVMVGAASPHPE